jgi:hypothetical protein
LAQTGDERDDATKEMEQVVGQRKSRMEHFVEGEAGNTDRDQDRAAIKVLASADFIGSQK